MDRYGNGAGAVNDQSAGYGGTYPANGAATPQQPLYNPQQHVERAQYEAALDEIVARDNYMAQLQQQQAAQGAQQALYNAEAARQQQYLARQHEARRIMNDDPERAVALMEEAAVIDRTSRLQERHQILNAAARTLEAIQQNAQRPQVIQEAARQYGLSQDSMQFLHNLPLDQVPAVAYRLGLSDQQVRTARMNAQRLVAQQGRQQLQQSGAHMAPAYQGAPSNEPFEPGSREHLRSVLQVLIPEAYQGGQ